jgi:hypothetical protein
MCRSRFLRRPPNVGGGLDAPRALLPARLAVAPVMWASQDAKLPRTDAGSGSNGLGQPLLSRNRLPGVALGQALQ